MSAAIEVRCHACPASTVVHLDGRKTIAHLLDERGWRNDRGVIACKTHRHITVMPRHRRTVKR